jgi:hypothetical protein
MRINPTSTRRLVMFDVQTIHTTIQTTARDQDQPSPEVTAGTEVITSIQMIVDDGMQVTEAKFYGAAERQLLEQFWRLVRPHDVFVGRSVASRIAFVRRRSWNVGLIPSTEVCLRTIYQHGTLETVGPSGGSDAGYRSAEVLASLLGLLGSHPHPESGDR